MVPTIGTGARVAVDVAAVMPRRGSVVVFRAPEAPSREFVKRVVGLPGDTIASNGMDVLVNGALVPHCLVGAFQSIDANGAARSGTLWLEALDGAEWLVFHSNGAAGQPSGSWTVPTGELFVLGDSRENSHDSRFWYGGKGGTLPLRLVVGTVTGLDAPVLPAGAEGLEPALARCRRHEDQPP
jgi:signal peptidase I